MSKAAKQSIFILIFLLVAVLCFAGYVILEKQKVDKENAQLQSNLEQAEKRSKAYAADVSKLKKQITTVNSEKTSLLSKVRQAESQLSDLKTQVDDVSQDRDKWKGRVEGIKGDRDKLMQKVQALNEQITVLSQQSKRASSPPASPSQPESGTETVQAVSSRYDLSVDKSQLAEDEHWAQVLKEKAALEIQIEDLKAELSKNSVVVVELKKANADLQIELDRIAAAKAEVQHEIKFKTDLVNKISLELARSKNDNKFIAGRIDTLTDENTQLRQEMKRLVTTKTAIEKSLVKIKQEKSDVEKELGQTESIIQSKIDEIWEIKESLDQTIKQSALKAPSDEVELPPILVTSDKSLPGFDTGEAKPGFDGKVVSINEQNNFVIVDIGETTGLRIGDALSIYRDNQYIARLEVIQVRRDISAADIKEKWTRVQVGDLVR